MQINLAELKEDFTRNGVLICFNGSFTHEIIEGLANAVKLYLTAEQAARSALMDVFAVFVEQAQNVRSYTLRMPLYDADPGVLQSAIIAIGRMEGRYCVYSGNYIANEDITPLTEKLDRLNSMERPEIQQFYKAQLRRELPPDSTSAGLGLIDMARRMREPFWYEVRAVDEHFSFYTVRVTV